jgi:hypothetical protein
MLLGGLEKIVGMLEFLSKLLAAEEMTIGRVLLPLAAMARVTFWSFWVAFCSFDEFIELQLDLWMPDGDGGVRMLETGGCGRLQQLDLCDILLPPRDTCLSKPCALEESYDFNCSRAQYKARE